MVTGKTKTGYKYSYNKKILSSMRYLEALLATEKEDDFESLSGLDAIVDMMLGDKKEDFYKHLEKQDPDGIATIYACKAEITDMINGAGDEGKN